MSLDTQDTQEEDFDLNIKDIDFAASAAKFRNGNDRICKEDVEVVINLVLDIDGVVGSLSGNGRNYVLDHAIRFRMKYILSYIQKTIEHILTRRGPVVTIRTAKGSIVEMCHSLVFAAWSLQEFENLAHKSGSWVAMDPELQTIPPASIRRAINTARHLTANLLVILHGLGMRDAIQIIIKKAAEAEVQIELTAEQMGLLSMRAAAGETAKSGIVNAT